MSRPQSEHRAWAKKHMVGVENITIPSFQADMTLDEEGIRHDVRQSKAHGFFSTLVATETGLSFDEAKRFVQIVCDEAGDDIGVSTTLLFDSLDLDAEMIRHAERCGVNGVLLGYPHNWRPKSLEEVEEVTRDLVASTDLAVVLYPSPHYGTSKFTPAWFPPDMLERLVDDLPNIVALKCGHHGLYVDAWHRFGDRILIQSPVERDLPMLVQAFGMQWMGAGCYEVLQSPEHPYVVDYFRLLREGQLDEGMAIYWKLAMARQIFDLQHFQTVMLGTHHWTQQKYYQWCVGGNGGVTREPSLKVTADDMQATKLGFMTLGIFVTEDDDLFYRGRAQAGRDAASARSANTPKTAAVGVGPTSLPGGA